MPDAWGPDPRPTPGSLVVFEFPLVGWDVDVLTHPELLVAPEPLVPYLAWPGRLTELAGPDKIGKSTLLRQAAIAVATRGEFLGQRLNGSTPARVLWLGLEESLADIWRPMYEMGYRPTERRIGFCTRLSSIEEFHEALSMAPDWGLIVVDTLAAFGYAMDVESERDETEMTRLLHVLLDVARKGPAVVLNHHVTKSEDNPRERGSGAIAATCDVVLTMATRKEDESIVDVAARGRMPVTPFAMQKSGGIFHLAQTAALAAHDAKAARVLQLVTAEPGSLTSNAVSKRLGGTRSDVLHAVERLVGLGILVRERGRLRPSGTVVRTGTRTSRTTESAGGTAGTPPKGGEYQAPYRTTLPPSPGAVPVGDEQGEAWEPDEPNPTITSQ